MVNSSLKWGAMGEVASRIGLGARPGDAARSYLLRGLGQPGGKLPLFDEQGQRIHASVIRDCIKAGWAEPWYRNPIMPDWLVCKLTDTGRTVLRAND